MKKILIVDDNEDNLYLLRLMLEGQGYNVEQAVNGSDAIDKVKAAKPGMIISDILMPVMDGFTLCKTIKSDEKFKTIPFVFFTATYTDPKDEKFALKIGADAFIVKPTEPDEFIKRIKEVLTANKDLKLSSKHGQAEKEEVILKEYNEVLIRKLEDKMFSLEQKNNELEAEIKAREKAENDLLSALHEKNVLLRELHHRVKNNMQLICSLINLQMNDNIKSLSTEKILTISKELQNRIRSMALVHETLYKSKSLSSLDFKEYLSSLIDSLYRIYKIDPDQIAVTLNLAENFVYITFAVPLGLIIDELVTNSIKFAFPDKKRGEIQIIMTIDDDGIYNLIISDNGIGLPADFKIDAQTTFGMELISILLKQINGSINISSNSGKGARFEIKFKGIEHNKSSILE